MEDSLASASKRCVIIGSGRFIRSVLVPPLLSVSCSVYVVQPRGRTFLDSLVGTDDTDDAAATTGVEVLRDCEYEVDTILTSGKIETAKVGPVSAVTSVKHREGMEVINSVLPGLIGVGLTEAGITKESTGMRALVSVLFSCFPSGAPVSVVNTDNLSNNGEVLSRVVLGILEDARLKADSFDFCDYGWLVTGEVGAGGRESPKAQELSKFMAYVAENVTFHSSMVDRIVGYRKVGANPHNQIPSCEPTPLKAICVEDTNHKLPDYLKSLHPDFGVHVRTSQELQADIGLKLRVCNGTHSPLAALLAITGYRTTSMLSSADVTAKKRSELTMNFLDCLFESSIQPGCVASFKQVSEGDIKSCYSSWRERLLHPDFGLSSYFICQNAATKVSLRLSPTINSVDRVPVSCALAIAFMLRYLTPCDDREVTSDGKYRGASLLDAASPPSDAGEEYAPGLWCGVEGKYYDFKCDCVLEMKDGSEVPLPTALMSSTKQGSHSVADVVGKFLKVQGVKRDIVDGVCYFYQRIIKGDDVWSILEEIQMKEGVFSDGGATDVAKLERR